MGSIDITNIVVAVIGLISAVLSVFIGRAWTTTIKPWLEEHHLTEAVTIAVRAAEAVYGRYKGKEKLTYALNSLKNDGWNIESDAVLDALEAAWNDLNIEQIASGIKSTDDSEEELPYSDISDNLEDSTEKTE